MRERAFSLVELLSAAVLVGILASLAAVYYRDIAVSARLQTAAEEMHRIRDELHRHMLVPGRRLPERPTDLKRLGDHLDDPWGNAYQFQWKMRRILSAGPDRILETPEDSPALFGDDLGLSMGRWGPEAGSTASPSPSPASSPH